MLVRCERANVPALPIAPKEVKRVAFGNAAPASENGTPRKISKRPACAPVAASARSKATGSDVMCDLQIARELTSASSAGTYSVGARMPTEFELCEQIGISRFTAPEAVRVLSSAGLVTRRQRVGTVVIATPADARYTHAAQSVADL